MRPPTKLWVHGDGVPSESVINATKAGNNQTPPHASPNRAMPTGTDRTTEGAEYRAIVERYDTRPNQCTIFRSDLPESDRTTTWITAHDGSYVALALMR